MKQAKRIEKKLLPEFFGAVESGQKKFELRLNDVEINEGDTLVLKEWDPEIEQYIGRELERECTYARAFDINDLYWSREEIDQYGLRIVSLE